ncbi:hypothetical protein JW933_00445 [candidate division FCPU426 bacterium]|nr:hypothetical protein [candidate division FCPU426 bacterium]
MHKAFWCGLLFLCLPGFGPAAATAAVWKAAGEIGLATFYAEMKDGKEPVAVLLRIENHSKEESLSISRDFVYMLDGGKKYVRPVSADEMVSGHLKRLRTLMPQHALEIDAILGEIQADFPQEKIVEVYGRLQEYMKRGRPITWRTSLENFLLGRRQSSEKDIVEAQQVIEEIGLLSKNYFWPNDIPPDSQYTGMVFFKKPLQEPASIYFKIGNEYIGTVMQITAGEGNANQP